MRDKFDQMTLEQLEGDYWPSQKSFPTTMIQEVFLARKIPMKDLSSNDLRLLASQNIGLSFILPYAIKILKENILEDAWYYPGDLLFAVLNVDKTFWKSHNDVYKEMIELLKNFRSELENSKEINSDIRMQLKNALQSFLKL
jgi:hypothetical protein